MPKKRPLVLVLLAAFDGIQWVSEQMDSILNQVEVDVRVVVSVDTSNDGTEAWFDELARRDSRIYLLSHGRVFGGAAPNFFRLIAETDFSGVDYVALADQDDIWMSNKLIHAVNQIQKKKLDAYSSNVIAFWPNGKQSYICKSQSQVKWDYLFEAAGPGCTYVFTKTFALVLQEQIKKHAQLISKIGLHDWFIYAFSRANQYKWFIDDQALMLYRQHASNQVGTNKGLKAFIVRLKKVLSGWAFSQSRLIAQAIRIDQTTLPSPDLKGGRMDFLHLAMQAQQCRRRPRDQIFFLGICLLLAIIGSSK